LEPKYSPSGEYFGSFQFKMTMKRLILAIPLFVIALPLVGCSKDSDPHEKIDAPGYYNGPMEPRGGAPKTGGATTGGSKAGGAAATTGN
jgi:hypothetical protein